MLLPFYMKLITAANFLPILQLLLHVAVLHLPHMLEIPTFARDRLKYLLYFVYS